MTSNATPKDLVLRPIDSRLASDTIKRLHYSRKVVQNSQIHIGVFLFGRLEGAIQYGPSLDKQRMMGLVEGTGWNEFIELNRLALSRACPRNSESRVLAVSFKILKKHAPQLKWIVSFADGTQSGDGAIYRATGFVLTAIKPSENLARLTTGETIHKMTLESSPNAPRPELHGKSYFQVTDGAYNFKRYVDHVGAELLPGFQLRYIKFLQPDCRESLTVAEIPYDEIGKRLDG